MVRFKEVLRSAATVVERSSPTSLPWAISRLLPIALLCSLTGCQKPT
jgi:hypothetical protein